MSTRANLAASVAARLLNRAKQTGDDYQTLLTSYCLERFLYRLGVSDLCDRFVLKGAMLLRLWSERPYRATLAEAVRRTFERRRTPIPQEQPIALTREYWDNPSRPTQVRAFARRAGIAVPEGFADECARILDAFLSPVLEDLRSGSVNIGDWPPGGRWR